MIRYSEEDRQRIARECLRRLWRVMDAGGHSMGRSIDSTFLELALRMLPPKDERAEALSIRSDEDPVGFLELARDVDFELKREKQEQFDVDGGYIPTSRSPWYPTWESVDEFLKASGSSQIKARSGAHLGAT